MFNSIESYVVVLIFVINTSAALNTKNGLFNVGTVLFTNNDVYKKRWSRTNIEVLQARRHFQNIIPPPSMNYLDQNYINNLLKYFKNTFKTLKREAVDPGLVDIMEKALSDAIGGYFKVWVLPVTKLNYYGGALSQDDAVQVFNFYEKLKRSLNTDGARWRKPSEIILNTIAITVIPSFAASHTRSIDGTAMKYPCEHLAYFEQSDAGLTIPTPLINWNDPPYSMFLPLKNESLIQLDSPSASKALLKYYDIAEGCCQSKNPNTCNDFDLRFQNWVTNNVVPHISDDKLYLAFGSLLSLLNSTNDYINKASNLCEYECDKFSMNSILSKLPPCMTSNKFFILILILILEIVWCIPAVIYVICSRRKSRMKQRTKFFLDICKRRRYHTVGRIDQSEERSHFINNREVNQKCQSPLLEQGLKLVQKPRERNKENVTQCPSYNLKRSAGQVTSVFADMNNEQECQSESVTLINEKITMGATRSSLVKLTVLPDCKDITNPNQTESISEVHKVETTITKIFKDKSRSNSKSCVPCASKNKSLDKMEKEIKQKLQELQDKDVNNDICPCTCCIEEDRKKMRAKRTTRLKESSDAKCRTNPNPRDIARPRNLADEPNKTKLKKLQPRECAPKNVKLNQSKGLKLNTGEPLLEIRIDRPAAEITVDITKTCRRKVRPSKIPRLATTANPKGESKLNSTPRDVKPSTCIQQASNTVKNRSVDDSDVQRKVVKHNKMNMTF